MPATLVLLPQDLLAESLWNHLPTFSILDSRNSQRKLFRKRVITWPPSSELLNLFYHLWPVSLVSWFDVNLPPAIMLTSSQDGMGTRERTGLCPLKTRAKRDMDALSPHLLCSKSMSPSLYAGIQLWLILLVIFFSLPPKGNIMDSPNFSRQVDKCFSMNPSLPCFLCTSGEIYQFP